MTYSPDHVADGQHLIALVSKLERDLVELRQLVAVCDDAATMPGRRRAGVDADGEIRETTLGPSRPTERTAIDGRRLALQRELKSGTVWLPRAIAIVRGVTASIDRGLLRWEGEDTDEVPGGLSSDHHNGAAEH